MFEIDPEYRPQDRIICSLFLVPLGLSIAGAASHNQTLSTVGGILGAAQGIAGGVAGATSAGTTAAEAGSTAAESGSAAGSTAGAAGSTAAAGSAATTAAESSPSLLSTSNLFKYGITGAQSVSGAIEKLMAAGRSEAEARALVQQGKYVERQQINKDLATVDQQKAIGAASNVVTTSGTPLSVFADSIRTLEMNAANARRTGTLQANARRAEAQQYYEGIPGAVLSPLAQNQTLLSQIMGRRGNA
jgi:hypothetical protein